jgi:elongation factor 1-gamma
MAEGTLYTFPENFRAYKALIAAQFSGAKIKVASESPDFTFGETNKSDEFLKKFPLGKVPAFEGRDGVLLFESNAIAFHVANAELRGKTPVDVANIQQWVEFADNEILPAALTWVFPCMGIMQYNKQNTEHAKEDVKIALGVLNKHLLTRTYLVTERITLADICVACNLLHLYQWVLEPEFRAPFQNVNRWFTTLVHQPQFEAVIGKNFVLCAKMAQFDAKKFEELQAARKESGKKDKTQHDKKADKKKSEQKTQPSSEPSAHKEQPAPAPTPAAAPVAAAAGDEEDDDELSDRPSKDPFSHLPKGTFNMEDWKRMYSNNDTKTVALPWFWEKFDKENNSLWYCEYKYPEELKMVFMSCNLVAGMFQRLDRMRKHAFGSMIVFGENNNNTISGVWMWRGQDLAFTLSEDLQIDYESYTWTKLDPNSPDTKKRVDEYLAWEGDFDGKKFNQGKIFK